MVTTVMCRVCGDQTASAVGYDFELRLEDSRALEGRRAPID